ncbi:MAG: MHYT domain-containing protein [Alphaproteobacteria bacterium]
MNFNSYFAFDYDPSRVLMAQYDLTLVAASYLIAGLAGFSFIRLLIHVAEQPTGAGRIVWQAMGALIMGVGVWAMHFVGMLAYRLPIPIIYDLTQTVLSILPAIAGSFVAIRLVGNRDVSGKSLLLGAVALGSGIGAMHYSGMAAMRLNAVVRYDLALFGASIIVAVALGLLALLIASWIVRRGDELQISASIAAAGIVGLAVAGMHYTAMLSTLCLAGGVSGPAESAINPDLLAAATGIAALSILAAAGGALAYDRRLTREVLQREEASRRALVSDQRLSEAMETLADDFAIFDSSDRLVFWNTHFQQSFIPDISNPTGMHFEQIVRAHLLRSFGSDPDADVPERVGEIMNHHAHPDAPLLWQPVPDQWALVRQRQTSDGGTVFLMTDISDVKRAELAAEQANQAKTEFLHSMSHELRTPLNGVIGTSEMLLNIDTIRGDQNRLMEYLNDIRSSGRHLLSLVTDILDMAAIERGTHTVSPETFDVTQALSEIVRTVRSAHGSDGVIEFAPPQQAVHIHADRRAFRQVITNLLTNAIQHGGGQGVLEISTQEATDLGDGTVRIVVSDQGPGIPSVLLEEIGQPFPHAHTPLLRNEVAGSGLGLAIVCQLMPLNGGRLEVISAEGAGTCMVTHWVASHADAEMEIQRDGL